VPAACPRVATTALASVTRVRATRARWCVCSQPSQRRCVTTGGNPLATTSKSTQCASAHPTPFTAPHSPECVRAQVATAPSMEQQGMCTSPHRLTPPPQLPTHLGTHTHTAGLPCMSHHALATASPAVLHTTGCCPLTLASKSKAARQHTRPVLPQSSATSATSSPAVLASRRCVLVGATNKCRVQRRATGCTKACHQCLQTPTAAAVPSTHSKANDARPLLRARIASCVVCGVRRQAAMPRQHGQRDARRARTGSGGAANAYNKVWQCAMHESTHTHTVC
jgi:hypothetical protein